MHHLVEAQARATPDAIAVVHETEQVSYRTLDRQATELAATLQAAGVSLETTVGVCCERSISMIVALLATAKAGAAYVPIDPGHPHARRQLIARDAGIKVVLTQAHMLAELASIGAPCIAVDASQPRPPAFVAPAIRSSNALLVLYTSGSTGQPKGVVIEHGAIVNRLLWAQDRHPYSEGEVGCARTTLSFVDSVAEIFAPLAFGIPLVIIDAEAQRDPEIMFRQLAAGEVSRLVLVPSLLSSLLEQYADLGDRLPSLRYWFLGGEPVPIALVSAFARALPGRKLINIYGATELSGDATSFDFDDIPADIESSPIGAPLSGVEAFIVDEALGEVAAGDVGEVCISGVCLARGYLGHPELTAERFVDNPLSSSPRLYRTGDRGRLLPSGDIEFLGRLDDQVKIRGMRVELGEVERALEAVPDISQAVVTAPGDGAGRVLAAFYTSSRELTPADVRSQMSRRLPDYMVPGRIERLDVFPINANGKIDRRALARRQPRSSGDAPVGEGERAIAREWCAVLGRDRVGRDEGFHDLGGNSLAAIRVTAALRRHFELELPIRSIFDHPTVASLAAAIQQMARGDRVAASAEIWGRPNPSQLPLTYHQFPFWLFHAVTGDLSIVSDAFELREPIDLAELETAYSDTVGSFDALWMSHRRWVPLQRRRGARPTRLPVSDHRESSAPEPDILDAESAANNSHRFEIDRPPQIAARLVRLRSGDRLLICMPHMTADMTSMELFRRGLCESLSRRRAGLAPAPPTGRSTLCDIVERERLDIAPSRLERDAAYWRAHAPGPALNRVPASVCEAKLSGREVRAFHQVSIAEPLDAGLAAFSQRRGVSVPITMLSALFAALSRMLDGETFTILLALDRRDRAETRELFTCMASTMPCRWTRTDGQTLDSLIEETRHRVLTSYEHADHMMRWPTFFNDFSAGLWPPLARIARAMSRRVVAAWPGSRLDPEVIARYLFALLPPPGRWWRALSRRRPAYREVAIVLNIMPEVYAEPPDPSTELVCRRRSLPMIMRPGDLIINTDAFLDNTLQVHVARDDDGLVALHLYGGGIDPAGLCQLGDHIRDVLAELAAGRGDLPVR